MTRVTDLMPSLNPEKVARAILKAMIHKKLIVDLPWYLRDFYALSSLMPNSLFRLMKIDGSGKKHYHSSVHSGS